MEPPLLTHTGYTMILDYSEYNIQYAPAPPFQELLGGKRAFYDQPDYLETTKNDFASTDHLLPPAYTFKDENAILSAIQAVASVLLSPLAVVLYPYRYLQTFVAKKFILPAVNYSKTGLDQIRSNIPLNDEWKYKRITIEVIDFRCDGLHTDYIDAMIVGKSSTLNNGIWVLNSHGNGMSYEKELSSNPEFERILNDLNGNGILFNPPRVGASTGTPNASTMAKVYRAVLSFVEDKNKGLGADKIFGWGQSIGAAAQGHALKIHRLKNGITYVFGKKQTFSNLSTMAAILTRNKKLGYAVKVLDWNLDSVESSKKLKAHEIIIQTADEKNNTIHDGVIPVEASLAHVLSNDPNKTFIAVRERHYEPLQDISLVTTKVNELFK